ncbi:glycosyltransferase [Pontibacter sp. KCTC 32443]|uniref:glycosyltransferase n=1 Tax=Pontibacter TaxID=323449 RepID=UPI00164EBD4B|nr:MULTISPECIES: glycosyltransferase [Pontibacter]MBC5773010.1 glycosyltransferase [Pontibacter sp. KCTC 32443]
MKICFISNGSFIHVKPYIDFFKIRGYDVSLIAITPPTIDFDIPVYSAWVGNSDKYKKNGYKKWTYFFSVIKAKKLIRILNPDIVHAHYVTSGGLVAWILNHPKTVLTAHGSDVNTNTGSIFWKFLLRLIFNQAKIINVVSSDLGKKVHQSFNVPTQKIVNINVGIDYNKYFIQRSELDTKSLGLNIICNRSFEAVYDHQTIFNSLKELKNRNIPFKATFLGDGSTKEQCIDFALQNDLNKNIVFLGKVNNNKQPEIFKQHNIYISASLSDGTSLSLLEAMTSGLLPVVSNIEANRLIFNGSSTPYMFNPRDYMKLADILEEIYRNGNIEQRVILDNQSIVASIGDRTKNMNLIDSIYKNLSPTYST